MKTGGAKIFWLAGAMLLLLAAANRAQPLPVGHATDFTTEAYFEAPNDQQIQMRLSGAEALPLPGGLLDVKKLKVETYATNGVLFATALAPQCTYAPLEGMARSAGPLEIRSGDGMFYLSGVGFLLQQTNQSVNLSLSNRVHTVIQVPESNHGLFL